MLIELDRAELRANAQVAINVIYDGILVGEFVADILVETIILVELKSVRKLVMSHEVQLVNYLNATGKPIGLLINFGESGVEIRRKYLRHKSRALMSPDPVNPVNPVKIQPFEDDETGGINR